MRKDLNPHLDLISLSLIGNFHLTQALNELQQVHLKSDILRLGCSLEAVDSRLLHRLLLLQDFVVHFIHYFQVELMQIIIHPFIKCLSFPTSQTNQPKSLINPLNVFSIITSNSFRLAVCTIVKWCGLVSQACSLALCRLTSWTRAS